MELIIGRQGNQPMPITDTTVSRRHARLRPLPDGTYELEGIEGRTFSIGGLEYTRKKVDATTPVTFGQLTVTVAQLLAAPAPPPPGPGPTPQDDYAAQVAALDTVWKDYNNRRRKLQLSVTKLNNTRMAVLPLGSLASIGASVVFAADNSMRMIGSVAGVIFTVGVSLVIGQLSMKRQREVQEQTEELTADFMLRYVCPNPKCKRFLGHTPFKVLKAQGACPFCKTRFR